MKKYCLRTLLALVGFVGLSGIAQAEVREQIVVTLPFDFVVRGQILPAGTYTVSSFSDDKLEGLVLSSYDNHVSVIVLPTTVGSAEADKPSVSFKRIGDSNVLSKIETACDVYTFPVSHAPNVELSMNSGHTNESGASGKQV